MTLHHDDQHQNHPDTPACRWFPGDPNTVRDVRRFVANRLGNCPRKDDAVLLASELATNAIQHTHSANWTTGFLASITHIPNQRIRVTISDAGTASSTPYASEPDPTTDHGRGLFLVERIATRWASCTSWLGQETWFEITCH